MKFKIMFMKVVVRTLELIKLLI